MRPILLPGFRRSGRQASGSTAATRGVLIVGPPHRRCQGASGDRRTSPRAGRSTGDPHVSRCFRPPPPGTARAVRARFADTRFGHGEAVVGRRTLRSLGDPGPVLLDRLPARDKWIERGALPRIPSGCSPACSPRTIATSRSSSMLVSNGTAGSIPSEKAATMRAASPALSAACSRNSWRTRALMGSSVRMSRTMTLGALHVMTRPSSARAPAGRDYGFVMTVR